MFCHRKICKYVTLMNRDEFGVESMPGEELTETSLLPFGAGRHFSNSDSWSSSCHWLMSKPRAGQVIKDWIIFVVGVARNVNNIQPIWLGTCEGIKVQHCPLLFVWVYYYIAFKKTTYMGLQLLCTVSFNIFRNIFNIWVRLFIIPVTYITIYNSRALHWMYT